jgi:hypothetical protein
MRGLSYGMHRISASLHCTIKGQPEVPHVIRQKIHVMCMRPIGNGNLTLTFRCRHVSHFPVCVMASLSSGCEYNLTKSTGLVDHEYERSVLGC